MNMSREGWLSNASVFILTHIFYWGKFQRKKKSYILLGHKFQILNDII